MAFFYRVFVVFAFSSVLGEWENVAAVNEATAIRVVPSPTITKNGSSLSNTTSHHMITTPTHNTTVTPHNTTVTPHNTTVTPHNTTVTPQNTTVTPHNTTVTPHNTTVTPHNTTVTPHNTTVTPHNTTVTPHNTTVTPHNTTVTPHNTTITPHNTTIMPHNSTVMPPHNMTITPSSAHTVMPTSSMHPTPTPTPAPKPGNFSVKDNGTVCLFAYMAAKFDIVIVSMKLSLELPTNATVGGVCDTSIQEPYITLNWQTMEGYSCNFTMHFVKVEGETLKPSSEDHWAAANLIFSLKNSSYDEANYTFHSAKGPLKQLSADYGYAYQCLTQPINFGLYANNSNVNVTLTNIHFQPFDVRDGHLGNVEKCNPPTAQPITQKPTTGKSKGHVVAIAVGCSLAALVIIVGIGYMIGRRRRRNQAAGYRKLKPHKRGERVSTKQK